MINLREQQASILPGGEHRTSARRRFGILMAVLIVAAFGYYYVSSLQRVARLEEELQRTSQAVAALEAALDEENVAVPATDQSTTTDAGGPLTVTASEGGADDEQTEEQEEAENRFAGNVQEIGKQDASGAHIARVRSGDHDTYFRLVWDIVDAGGGNFGAIPYTRAALVSGENRLVAEISGVAQDAKQSAPGIDRNITVNDDQVQSVRASVVPNSNRIQYNIALSENASFDLSSRSDPARIVLDIQK